MSIKFINADAESYFEERSNAYFEGQDDSPVVPIAHAIMEGLDRFVSNKADVMDVVWEIEEDLQNILPFSPMAFRNAVQLVVDVSQYGRAIYESYPTEKEGRKLLHAPQFDELVLN